MEIKGIDVSSYQGTIDWKKVSDYGMGFTIIRITEKGNKIDSKFEANYTGCTKYKIPVGVYKYSYATTVDQIKAEANAVIKTLNKRTLQYPIFLDIEDKCQANLSKDLMMKMINAFRDIVVNAGYKFGIYCGYSWFQNKLPADAKKYDNWVARYPARDTGELQERLRVSASDGVIGWQYSSKCTLPGIPTKVDRNVFYKDYSKVSNGNSTNSSTNNSSDTNKGSDTVTKVTTTKNVRMSNCGHDENGRYAGGKAGDQTGTEWYLRAWYSYPWNYIIRWKDRTLGNLFADLSAEAANNNLIGYDQGTVGNSNDRYTFRQQMKVSGYRPSKIKKACECDCSESTIVLIQAVGYLKGIPELQKCNATYTGNMMNYFRSANGQKYFTILTGKYLTNSSYAMRGDINLNTAHHVNITVDNGVNCGLTSSTSTSTTPTNTKNYLTVGDKGDAVKTLQTKLNKVGYKLTVDGEYGSATKAAVTSFQKKYNLEVDGVAGKNTITKLDSVIAAQSKKNTGTASKAPSKERKFVGKVNKNNAPVRKNPGKKYAQLKSYPTLNKGNLVDVCDTIKSASGNNWYYICIGGKIYGYIYSEHIDKA